MPEATRARFLLLALPFASTIAACSSSGGPASAVGPDPSTPLPPSEPVSLSSTTLSFDPGVSERSVRLVNPGPGTPPWRSEPEADWVSTAPAAGTLAMGETEVRIVVRRDGLAPGAYRATIRFVVDRDTLRADVTVEIPARAEAVLEPDRLDLGPGGSGTATLENRGGATLTWSIASPSWITVSPPAGELDPGGSIELVIDPDRSGRDPGVHDATLRLSSNGGDLSLPVRVEVAEPPRISIDPTVLDFGADDRVRTFTIENPGGTMLSWSASTNRPWVSIDAPSGTVPPGGSFSRTATVDRSSLDPGHHSAIVGFTGNGGTASLRIDVEVPSEPTPDDDPSGDDPDDDPSEDDPDDDPSGNDPPQAVALSGRIVGQFGGAGLAGLTVWFAGESVTTAADGSFEVPGSESTSLRSLEISGSSIVDRETFARNGDGTWSAIPSSFDIDAFTDVARDFEPRTIRWTSNPRIYVDTRPVGFEPGADLDDWVQEVAASAAGFARAWSDETIRTSDVRVGSDPPVDSDYDPALGWIVVRFSEDPEDYPSEGTIGVARTFWGPGRSILAGTITLRFGDFAGPGGSDTRRAVFGHELGHTFGMGHMDGRTASLMTPSITEDDLTAFDRSSGSILYGRSPGNLHPDRDDLSFFQGGLAAAAAPIASHGWVCGDPALPRGTRGP